MDGQLGSYALSSDHQRSFTDVTTTRDALIPKVDLIVIEHEGDVRELDWKTLRSMTGGAALNKDSRRSGFFFPRRLSLRSTPCFRAVDVFPKMLFEACDIDLCRRRLGGIHTMKALRRIAVITLAIALSGGCMNRADIDKHFENQEKIIAKLDELKKGAGPAGKAPARPKRPAGPDRAKTYSVPVTADTAQFGKVRRLGNHC